jgi:hypothetical protein
LKKIYDSLASLLANRQVSICTSAAIIILIIVDLFATRQIVYLDNTSEIILFTLTVVVGYGLGSWILLEYTKRVTADLRSKSLLINTTHWTVTIIQFSLLVILLFVLFNNSINCLDYFSKCTNVRTETTLVYVISSIAASIIMGIISFKFFSWYKLNKRNFMVLFFGLATATFAIAITEDAYTKLIFIYVLEEKTPSGVGSQASFIYLNSEKYKGEIQYKVVNPNTTSLWILPSSLVSLKNSLDYLAALPYVFTWLGVAVLLHQYYKSVKSGKFPIKFWILLAIPLVLYLIGSGLIISLPADIPYRFYFRLIFRGGTIASSLLFGLAFYLTTRNVTSVKVRDYLAISAMGIIPIGIANEISALQQTYGVAAHSLVFLSSYLFVIGLYSLAISVAQDSSLRKSIRKSTIELLGEMGTAQMEQEILGKIRKLVQNNKQEQEDQSGISSSLTTEAVREYTELVIRERESEKEKSSYKMDGK